MSSPQPPIVLVTGANKGIGFEVVRQLVQHGCDVWLTARDRERGQEAVRSIGDGVRLLQLDVTDPASVEKAAADFAVVCPRLDVLVNNAGTVLDPGNSLLGMSEDTLRRTFDLNTLGPIRVIQAFAPMLRRSPAPRIINVSSGAGQLSDPSTNWAPAYCISKTALNAVTVQLASDMPAVAVNSVYPGWVRTDTGGADAPRSVEQGADTIVWLATTAPHALTGRFFRDRRELPW